MANLRMCLILSENWTMTAGRDLPALVRWAREAEDAGFDSVMISEHIALGPAAGAAGLMANPREYALPGNQDPATPWPSSLVLLSAIAAVTQRVRLVASAVIAPLRHPLLLARELGSLDLLSGGRLVVQPTVSWLPDEYEALGVPFRRRGALLDEHLAAWSVLWRDTPASYSGRALLVPSTCTSSRRPWGPKARPCGSAASGCTPACWTAWSATGPATTPRPPVGRGAGRPRRRPRGRRPGPGAAGARRRHPRGVPRPRRGGGSGQALDAIPEQAAAGFTTFCIKPSQFTDDPADVAACAREIIRRVATLFS